MLAATIENVTRLRFNPSKRRALLRNSGHMKTIRHVCFAKYRVIGKVRTFFFVALFLQIENPNVHVDLSVVLYLANMGPLTNTFDLKKKSTSKST